MKKSTIALLVCFVFALGMVYTPSAEAANGDLLAQIIGKIKTVVEKIKENRACKADPESCVEPPKPPPPIVIPEPYPPSPNAFGEPTASVPDPSANIKAVRGVRSRGWTEQTRSEVLARNGVVTTSTGHAAAAGLQILQAGGNAIDAAVATMGMIALTEPGMCGLGADMFAIIYDAKTKQLYQISANSPAPKNYNRELFAANGQGVASTGELATFGNPATVGIWSAMIPGAVDGWDKMLNRFGTMNFKQVLEPARKKAIEGFPVEEVFSDYYTSDLCTGDPDTAAVYCKDGVRPSLYKIFKNPDMARTFQVLQEQGVDGFYRGEVAQAAVAKANSLVVLPPGMTEFWQLSDFADFEAKWVEPLTTNYRGYDLYETPPRARGGPLWN